MISEGESMDVSSKPIAHKLGKDLFSKKQHAAKMRAAHGVATTYQKGGYLSYHGPVSKVRAATTQHYGDESLAKKNHPHLFNESMNHKSILSVAEAYAQMVSEANTDHSAAANAASEHAKNTPSMATHHAASNAHEKAASALESEVDRIKETDHTGKYDDKVMKMERDIKSHQQQAQRHRFHAHRIASTQKESFELTEKLDPKADAGTWIHDFVHSDDPKFAGKSAEERKNQALAAYYQARRDAGLKNEDTGEEGEQSNKRPEIDIKPDTDNLAATDAATAQKKQEPQDEIPSWVPGNIENKKEFAEAAKKAWESDNNTFDFKGRTYKITEKLVGNQDKLDVNNNGKIDGDDLAALRAGKPANEDTDCETETPGQSAEMPEGQPKGDGDGDEDDSEDMGDDDKDQGEMKESNDLTETSAAELGHKARGLSSGAKTPADHKAAAKAHAKAAEAYRRRTTGTAGKNPGKSEEAAHSAALAHEKMADKHHEKSMKESVDNPTDKLTLDVPAMIRSLEKAREDFKSDEDVHNFVQGLLAKKDNTIDTNALPKETVKEGGPGDAEAGPMVMDPVTQDTKDDHDENTKVEDAPYTNKADGSETVTPADKPAAKPSPMPKLAAEQTIRSVAEAYAKMTESSHFKPGPYGSPSPHSASNASQGAMQTSWGAHTAYAASDAHWHAASDHQSAANVHNTAANLHKKLLAKAKDPAEIKHHTHMIAFHNAGSEFHNKVANLHKQHNQ